MLKSAPDRSEVPLPKTVIRTRQWFEAGTAAYTVLRLLSAALSASSSHAPEG